MMFRFGKVLPGLFRSGQTAVDRCYHRYMMRKLSTESRVSLRFIQFVEEQKTPRIGIVSANGESFIDLSTECSFPHRLKSFLQSKNQSSCLKEIEKLLAKGAMTAQRMTDEVKLLSPIIDNVQVLSVNVPQTSPDALDSTAEAMHRPIISNKLFNSVIGPTDFIFIPSAMEEVYCRTELAVVIGKPAKFIKKSEAMDCVFGYTTALNVYAEKVLGDQTYSSLIGTSADTFCVVGPEIVHKKLIPDPYELMALCSINGQQVQCDSLRGLGLGIDEIIEFITEFIALDAGDVILTGPPNAINRNCSVQLNDGDVVQSEIEEIGVLRNLVIEMRNVNIHDCQSLLK